MIRNEIINVMAKCSCGTRIAWTRSNDTVEHRGVVDEFYPQNGAEDAYLAVIEPGTLYPGTWCPRNSKNINFGGPTS